VIAATADLHHVSFDALYGVLCVAFVLGFGVIALLTAPNDLASIVKHIGYATALAPFAAACFSVPIWIVIKVA
jgi:hypothetical protein